MILHSHLRPGGVRRVIEMYLPALAACGEFDTIILASGEPPDRAWAARVKSSVNGVRFTILIEPALGYLAAKSGDAADVRRDIRAFLTRCSNAEALVWAHNLGLGRNILLADELARHSAETGVPILSQHHDFWFDNRWARWPVLRANGFGSLEKVARAIFASGGRAVHAAINSADESVLGNHLPGHTVWLPNPASRGTRPSPGEIRKAKAWLRRDLGHRGPVWIFPTRFLRRKNLGEAVLLTRWLRPEAILVTTAGVSSPEESDYARRLEEASKRGGWPVRFQILSGREGRAPSVPALMCASENTLLTSIQEGFGLPFLEAAALGRPLLARRMNNVEPDLLRLGFRFPGTYDEVLVPPDLFDHASEIKRQELAYGGWKRSLPQACRHFAGIPPLMNSKANAPAAFSRLTLEAQLEILSIPPAESWSAAAPCNPGLLALAGPLMQEVEWPAEAESRISPAACTERLLEAVRNMPESRIKDSQAIGAQGAFIAEHLKPEFLYPLLMNPSRSV
ncbi:MAG: hypothetical protein WC003_00155 [Terrimicrobiaceae bacterium]